MAFIVLSQILFIALLVGTGRLLWAGFGFAAPRNPWLLAWLGFFAASTFAMGYALFLPLDGIPFVIFAMCGAAGLGLFGRDLRRVPPESPGVSRWFWAALLLLLFALDYTTAIKVWGMLEGDTGLYHAALVRWLNEYGTVPGSANLHGRFGNVSLWFDFAALIEVGPWVGRSAAVLPGIGLICGLMYVLHEILHEESKASRIYALVFLGYILILFSRYSRPTLYYDFPALILNGIVLLESLKILLRDSSPSLSRLCLVTFLVAAAFAIKTVPVVSVLMVSGMVLWRLRRDSRLTMDALLCVFGLPVVAAVLWMGSNVVLSGYPFFPLTFAGFPVDWRVSPDLAQGVYDDVRAWGRLPGADYRLSLTHGIWFWLKPWLLRVPVQYPGMVTVPFVLGMAGWIYALWRRRDQSRTALIFLLWTGLGVAYWFSMAPDMRFGGGLLWSFLACAAVFAIPEVWAQRTVWIHRGVTAAVAITAVALLARFPVWKETGPQWETIPPMYSSELTVYEVQNGVYSFTVWVPADGEYCVNAPIPCTPTPTQAIRLRDPFDMGNGFAPLNADAERRP